MTAPTIDPTMAPLQSVSWPHITTMVIARFETVGLRNVPVGRGQLCSSGGAVAGAEIERRAVPRADVKLERAVCESRLPGHLEAFPSLAAAGAVLFGEECDLLFPLERNDRHLLEPGTVTQRQDQGRFGRNRVGAHLRCDAFGRREGVCRGPGVF